MSTQRPTLHSTLPKNSLWNALATVWQTGVMYLMVPHVLRLTGESHYGLWVLLSTLSVSGALGFLDLGLNGSVVKWVAEHSSKGEHELAGRVVDVAVAVFVPIGVASALLLVVLRPWFVGAWFDIPLADRPIASAMIVGLAIQVACDFIALPFAAVAQAFLRFGFLRALQSIKLTLFGAGSVLALHLGYGIEALALIAAGLSLAHVPLLVWLARKDLPSWTFGLRFPRDVAGPVVAFSAKVLTLRITGALYRNMDKLILGVMLGTVAVKNYDLVYKVHALALMPISFVTPLIVPLASRLAATDDRAGLRELMVSGSKYMGALCVPVAAATSLLAEPLLRHWLGPSEAAHATLVQLFVAYLFFWPLIQVGWNTMIGMNLAGPLVVVSVATVGANFVLSLLLVRPMGMAGVVVATVASNAVAFVAYLVLSLRALEVPLSAFARVVALGTLLPTAACAASVLALRALHAPSSLLQTLLYLGCGIGAGLLCFAAFGVDAEEREKLVAGWKARS